MSQASQSFDGEKFEVVGERPYYAQGATTPKFQLGDGNIYLSVPGGIRQGPFKIASVDTTSTPIKYKLCRADNTSVDNGALFEETRLTDKP
ncbi:hypothetical protein ACLMJK_009401 [Lecanora helva]